MIITDKGPMLIRVKSTYLDTIYVINIICLFVSGKYVIVDKIFLFSNFKMTSKYYEQLLTCETNSITISVNQTYFHMNCIICNRGRFKKYKPI